jgi:hypothetical protein
MAGGSIRFQFGSIRIGAPQNGNDEHDAALDLAPISSMVLDMVPKSDATVFFIMIKIEIPYDTLTHIAYPLRSSFHISVFISLARPTVEICPVEPDAQDLFTRKVW